MSQEIEGNQDRFNYYADADSEVELERGLNEETIRLISEDKEEPEWMLERRLRALRQFREMPMPDSWPNAPDLSGLEIESIVPYIRPDTEPDNSTDSWEDLPEEIQDTFDKLGIPEAEKNTLSGVGAQYESEVVYQNMQERWEEKGVIFCDMDEAVREHEEIVKEYFMTKAVPPSDNKFAALHGAVWSGGSFVYVPEDTTVEMPVQAYFRMDSENMGQFEHTLIIAEKNSEVHYIEGCSAPQYASTNLHAGGVEVFVGEDAHVQYSTIQNWSKNTYNLNTKRALVDSNGTMEWVSGSLGSKATMLYPSSVLKGEGASDNHITIAFAGEGQDIDTGAKVYHNAPRTTSTIESKSISKNGGRTNYRGLVHIANGAKDSSTAVECFPRGTPIYTSSGFKPIEDIEIDEYVMTHKGRFQPVQEVIRNKPKDDMIEIDVAGSGEKLVLTNSHPVLADTRDNYPRKNANFNLNWIEAEELREHDYMAVPRPELDENFTKFEQLNKSYGNKYSKELQLDNITLRRLCRFIGYYIAEGCTDERGQRVHFSFNSSEEEYISEVEEVIQDIGLNVSVRSDKDNCTEVFTDSIALADYMKRFGKRHNEKTIPSDYMNEECLRHIIPTMYYGDGTLSRDDSSRIHYTTASADLARSLRLALSYFGIGCVENIKRQAGRKPAYIVDISGKSTEEFLNKFDIKGFSVSEIDEDRRCMEITEDYIIYPIRDVSRVEYNEEVYNLDVKSDSSYTANLYAVHNCDALMFDNESTSDTMPFMEIKENDVDVAHEATVGKIGDEDVFYLQSRGLDDDDAKQMIVNGFIEPLTEELPIEYAVELNRLIELEMEGSLG